MRIDVDTIVKLVGLVVGPSAVFAAWMFAVPRTENWDGSEFLAPIMAYVCWRILAWIGEQV